MSARSLPRAAVVALAALSALALGASPAGAAAALTIALDPHQVGVFLVPAENQADPEDVEADRDGDWYTPVEVEWGGAVVVQLPAGTDGSAASWTLDTGSDMDDEPTRSLSSEAIGADHLDVTDLGGDAHRVALPSDPAGGPIGLLSVDGVTGSDEAIEAVGPLFYLLEFTASGTSVVTLEPQLSVFSSVPCGFDLLGLPDRCPPYQVAAGDTVGLTVPEGSLLRSLGFGGFDDVVVALSPVEFDGDDDAGYEDGLADGLVDDAADAEHTSPDPTPAEAMARVAAVAAAVDGATDGTPADAPLAVAPRVAPADAEEVEGVPLTGTEYAWLAADGLLPLSLTPSGAEVTLPADTEAGTYQLMVLEGIDAAGPSSTVLLTLEVAAANVVAAAADEPAAAPVLNRGLVSATGWTDPAAPGGTSPLVALGGGAVLVAGLGAAVVLRPRRRPAGD